MLKTLQTAKFDETVEVHMRLGLNVRHAEQQLRGTLFLPHGTGSSVTVAVFAQGEKAKEAEEAGADVVGGEDLAAKVLEGFSDFDVAIATPDMMGTVGKLGRVLGPQGKMPSPKAGTITFDVSKAVSATQVGQDRVPHRSHRDRARRDRQEVVRGAGAGRELRCGAGGDPAGQARRRQGPVSEVGDDGVDDGTG